MMRLVIVQKCGSIVDSAHLIMMIFFMIIMIVVISKKIDTEGNVVI